LIVLGVETSTPVSSVALASEQGAIASMTLARGRGHVEFIAPAIRHICDQSGVDLGRVAGIAVGLGPGLFTGMRVGIATAKSLAQVLGVPVVGIPSLDLLAFDVRHTLRVICACIDARRGEVFSAFYRQVPGGVQRISEYHVEKPQRLANEVDYKGGDVLFVGNGALLYREILPSARSEFASISRAFPSAAALVELALHRFLREQTDSIHDLEPLYLRKADVRIGWETRGVAGKTPRKGSSKK
jgi:tRNA threonylcarbamoyladenosine biosynthesis protein TsaB